jgi:hypothetical protein
VCAIANRSRFNIGETAVAPTLTVKHNDLSCFNPKNATECIGSVVSGETRLALRVGIDEWSASVLQQLVQLGR